MNRGSSLLGRLRYRIDTVFGQFVGRYQIQAGLGQGFLASAFPAAAEGAQPYNCLLAEPGARESNFAMEEVAYMEIPAHRVSY